MRSQRCSDRQQCCPPHLQLGRQGVLRHERLVDVVVPHDAGVNERPDGGVHGCRGAHVEDVELVHAQRAVPVQPLHNVFVLVFDRETECDVPLPPGHTAVSRPPLEPLHEASALRVSLDDAADVAARSSQVARPGNRMGKMQVHGAAEGPEHLAVVPALGPPPVAERHVHVRVRQALQLVLLAVEIGEGAVAAPGALRTVPLQWRLILTFPAETTIARG